jgi:5-methylcytosine-specific restriction endonuclease McrA
MSDKIYEDRIEQDLIMAIYNKVGRWRKVAKCIETCSGVKMSAAMWWSLVAGTKPFSRETQNAVRSCFPGWPSALLNPVDLVERYSLHNAVIAENDPNTAILIRLEDKNVTGIMIQTVEHASPKYVRIQIELFLGEESQETDLLFERPIDILELYHTDKRCAYCGAAAPLTVDHITPKSRGGPNSKSNLVWCCLSCNSRKMSNTPEMADMPIIFQKESEIK